MSENILKTLIYIVTYWNIAFGIIYIILVLSKVILKDRIKISYRQIHLLYLLSLVLYVFLATFSQYKVWILSELTKSFAIIPISNSVPLPGFLILFKPILMLKYGYLIHYSLIHFFASIFWGSVLSFIFYYLLKIIMNKRPYLLNNDELNIILASLLVISWPNNITYIVFLFVIFLIHSVMNKILEINRTTIFVSAILALLLVLIIIQFIPEYSVILKELYFIEPK